MPFAFTDRTFKQIVKIDANVVNQKGIVFEAETISYDRNVEQLMALIEAFKSSPNIFDNLFATRFRFDKDIELKSNCDVYKTFYRCHKQYMTIHRDCVLKLISAGKIVIKTWGQMMTSKSKQRGAVYRLRRPLKPYMPVVNPTIADEITMICHKNCANVYFIYGHISCCRGEHLYIARVEFSRLCDAIYAYDTFNLTCWRQLYLKKDAFKHSDFINFLSVFGSRSAGKRVAPIYKINRDVFNHICSFLFGDFQVNKKSRKETVREENQAAKTTYINQINVDSIRNNPEAMRSYQSILDADVNADTFSFRWITENHFVNIITRIAQ